MSLSKKVKTALDENRLLILGAQVLFGFQMTSVFQEAFAELALSTRLVNCAAQALMVLSITLLIAPSMQHRIVEGGADTNRILRMTSLFACLALLPFELSLGLSAYLVFDQLYGTVAAFIAGTGFCLLAGFFWFGLEFIVKPWVGQSLMHEEEKPTPLPVRIDQMLTEARVIIPGGQALLGFQFTVTLTRAFAEMPDAVKLLHIVALCCVGLAVILLMTPAALHRITFGGADKPAFFRLGSAFVIAAPAPLALGISGDVYVAAFKASESAAIALWVGSGALVLVCLFWYAVPIYLRQFRHRGRAT
jgi:hypothetical protein